MEAYLIEAEAYSGSEPYLTSSSGRSWQYTLSDSPDIEFSLLRSLPTIYQQIQLSLRLHLHLHSFEQNFHFWSLIS